MYKGIDVSKHNGIIDWGKVNAEGRAKFAMIHLGYGSDIKSQDDKYFEVNVKGAENAGIPWSAYLYSYALNEGDAKSEAQHTTYVVKMGDSLWKIAHDYHTTVDALAKLNGITNPSLIYPGQKLIIK